MRRPDNAQSGPSETCIVDGCERQARKAGRCWGHEKQRQREIRRLRAQLGADQVDPDEVPNPTAELRPYRASSWSWLARWALAYADVEAEDDNGFRRTSASLRRAAQAYVDTTRAQAAKHHGRQGGLTRAAALSQARRREIARQAAAARWRQD